MLRIEIHASTQRIHRDGIGLYLLAVARERGLDHEGEKLAEPRGVTNTALPMTRASSSRTAIPCNTILSADFKLAPASILMTIP